MKELSFPFPDVPESFYCFGDEWRPLPDEVEEDGTWVVKDAAKSRYLERNGVLGDLGRRAIAHLAQLLYAGDVELFDVHVSGEGSSEYRSEWILRTRGGLCVVILVVDDPYTSGSGWEVIAGSVVGKDFICVGSEARDPWGQLANALRWCGEDSAVFDWITNEIEVLLGEFEEHPEVPSPPNALAPDQGGLDSTDSVRRLLEWMYRDAGIDWEASEWASLVPPVEGDSGPPGLPHIWWTSVEPVTRSPEVVQPSGLYVGKRAGARELVEVCQDGWARFALLLLVLDPSTPVEELIVVAVDGPEDLRRLLLLLPHISPEVRAAATL